MDQHEVLLKLCFPFNINSDLTFIFLKKQKYLKRKRNQIIGCITPSFSEHLLVVDINSYTEYNFLHVHINEFNIEISFCSCDFVLV